MGDLELLEAWRKEEAVPFTGWNFSHLDGRAIEDDPPWSYLDAARDALRGAASALDLGTGGGEQLAKLRDAFPASMVATEAYAPNVEVARARLAPLGVTVVSYEADEYHAPLPFGDASFDVVLDRHEAYEAGEVARVLRPGGTFVTQQVDSRSMDDLLSAFGTRWLGPEVTLQEHSRRLRVAGLALEVGREWFGRMVFRDVGAIVYYLKAVPWLVRDFSVDTYAGELLDLHARLRSDGALAFREGRFLIRARRSAILSR